eukprot:m.189777 g.189777  ORF g.189777 m.189777 type:complete len:471 (+) comp14800_c1_seq1:62-1474(+)
MIVAMMSTGLAVCLLSLAVFTTTATAIPRGVAPQNVAAFSGDQYVCDGGARTLSMAEVNDDFCDCQDGTDEPGTSACDKGIFFCANDGYTSLQLISSRVNDGVCDCCDGSDEYNNLVTCENTCDEMGRQARLEAEEKLRTQRAGYSEKLNMIARASELRLTKQSRLDELEPLVAEKQQAVDDLKARKEELEVPEREAKSQFDEAWNGKVASQLKNVQQWLFGVLDADGSASVTREELQQNLVLDADGDGAVSDEELLDLLDFDGDGSLSDEESVLTFDSFVDELHSEIIAKFAEHDGYEKPLEEADKPSYPEDVQAAIDAAEGARSDLRHAEAALRDITNERDTLVEQLGYDAGASSEYFGLLGQCFEYIDREYKYKICPFDKATQEPKKGGRSTSLGKWNGFADEYAKMSFTNGEKCWNGPARSMSVTVVCGSESALLDVQEPNRCEYTTTLTSPAACKPVEGLAHDEL